MVHKVYRSSEVFSDPQSFYVCTFVHNIVILFLHIIVLPLLRTSVYSACKTSIVCLSVREEFLSPFFLVKELFPHLNQVSEDRGCCLLDGF